MAKLYMQAKDKNVVATYIYKKANETKAYKDAAFEVQYRTSELKEAFLKGAIIVLPSDGGFVKPIQYSVSSNIGSVSYITPNGTTATSADIASLVAVADS